MQRLVCLTDLPYIAGTEVAILTDAPEFDEDRVGEVFVDDPWLGSIPLTVVPYSSVTYPTFNTWGSIMFNASATRFRSGTPVWWGVLWAYVIARGSFVLTT